MATSDGESDPGGDGRLPQVVVPSVAANVRQPPVGPIGAAVGRALFVAFALAGILVANGVLPAPVRAGTFVVGALLFAAALPAVARWVATGSLGVGEPVRTRTR